MTAAGGKPVPGMTVNRPGSATISVLVLASMLEGSDDDKNVARETMGKLLSETQGV